MTPAGKLRRQVLALLALAPLLPADAAGIADVAVRDQDGRALRFNRDLVQGRVVAINFVFTGCSAVCPLMGANFACVQQLLGDRAPLASLISVSIDPLNDTPAQLREWRDKFSTKPGWTLVTGRKNDMERLLQSLGAAAPDPGAHAPFILIVDGLHGSPWLRMDGLADPATVAAALRQRTQLK
ncbi:SCO family protein [Duganella sp. CT11-25]|uniref:SCO family protein n=1 Tax=unclassified Duganella TaxID=2636909 RepID=UPI0039B05414